MRVVKWLVAIVLLLVLLLAAVALGLQRWAGSDDFRARISQQASAALGVPVSFERITVDVWPLPAVGLDKVQIKSQPPLTLERVEARPVWASLLRGKLDITTLLVRQAVIPEQAVAGIAAAVQKAAASKKQAAQGSPTTISILPRDLVLDQVTWVYAKGGSTTVDARARLDDDAMPATARIDVRKGHFEGASAALERQGDHWMLKAQIGGGTVNGKLQLQPHAKAGTLLQGEFDTAGVEVSALSPRGRTLTGRLEARTTLRSEFRDPGALVDALQTQTRFTVHSAVVHGIDLAQAVKTVGLNRSGETRLDTLAGNVATRGHVVQVSNLVATSGALSANGNVTIAANRSLSGRVTVDLASAAAGGTLGVPLVVGGTLDSPSVTLSRGALVGAAIGTVIAPGVGTGAGAKLGDRLSEGLKGLFGK